MRSSEKKANFPLILQTFLRVGCGALLIYASLDKLGDPEKFLKVIENYNGLPADLLPLTAVIIPWLEFFTGVSLAVGFKWRGGAFLFCVLMGIYALALGWNLSQGAEMNCGCFSMDSTEKLTIWTVLRDLIFLGAGLVVLTAEKTYVAFSD